MRPYATTSGLLIGAAGAPVALVAANWQTFAPFSPPTWLAGLATVTLLLAGYTLPSAPRQGRVVATLGIALLLSIAAPVLIRSPAASLAAALVSILAIGVLWGLDRKSVLGRPSDKPLRLARVWGTALSALALWLVVIVQDLSRVHPAVWVGVGAPILFAMVQAVMWALVERKDFPRRAPTVLVLSIAALAIAAALAPRWWDAVSVGAGGVVAMLFALPSARSASSVDLWGLVAGHPERLFVLTFVGLCTGGTVLLALPQSAAGHAALTLGEAAFTAVSAVCVTGLVVVDTGTAFSAFGQAMLLLLIQLGGLGIMAFSTVALSLLGRRVSLQHEGALAGLMSSHDRGRVFAATRRLVGVTFLTEALGAVLLLAGFVAHGATFSEAIWPAVFTAVSAFCNAGFALPADSLIGFQSNPLVLHTVAVLIVLGGLSPGVVVALPHVLAPSRPARAQIKLVLVTTLTLLAVGFVGFLAFEWNGVLAPLGFFDRLHNAWFQSVTFRTAGFNSVSFEALHEASLTLIILLMFVGGSPGGTAGGIKTTTVAVLALAIRAAVRGQVAATAFGRTVPTKTVYKAAAIATVGALGVVGALVAMQLTQGMPTSLAIFEVVSALGTVGLSIGGTAALDDVGRVIIMACMFIGRIGTLTLFLILSQRSSESRWSLPDEEIDVG